MHDPASKLTDHPESVTFQGQPLRVMQVMAGAREGGAETFFVSLVLALHRAGLDQLVVIRRNLARSMALRQGGVEPVELPFGRWFDFHTVPVLRRQARIYQPHVVMTWMNRASGMFPRGDFLRLARLGGYYDLKHYRSCDHLIANTQDIVEFLVARGWPRARTHYLPNFAAIGPVGGAAKPVPRERLDTPADAPLLLALGRLHRAKALDVLLQALTLETRPYLWIAGDGPLRAKLQALAEELGVAARVRFLGWRDDRDGLFGAADICVFPSRYEPYGNVIMEAWGQRTPLIAAASTGPLTYVRDGEDGLLTPVDHAAALAAAIGRVIDEPALAARLVEGGWRRYQDEFTEAASVARYLHLFQRLLAERAGGERVRVP
jgi:glycosyltransferase involved in cell wall biosynthesis